MKKTNKEENYISIVSVLDASTKPDNLEIFINTLINYCTNKFKNFEFGFCGHFISS